MNAQKPLKLLGLLLCLLPTSLALGQASKEYPTVAARRAFYVALAEKYNSKGVQEILHSDKKNEFEAYVEGHSEKELVEEFETVVHELLHGYNGQDLRAETHTYFPGPGERVAVPATEVFSSRELNGFVRKGLQDSIFRYGTYVAGKPGMAQYGKQEIRFNNGGDRDISSVVDGFYGLLEEFNAYYFGTVATWELYDYYRDTYGNENPEIWSDYKHQLLGNAVAYYEFRLFMAWYLDFAQQKHPAVYEGLIENQVLRKTFTLLDDRFGALNDEIEAALPELDRLTGPDVEDMLVRTGSDEEIKSFLAENGIDAEAMGIQPGSKEWEALRQEYLRAMDELKASVAGDLEFFHGQPKSQMAYLKQQFGKREKDVLRDFILQK